MLRPGFDDTPRRFRGWRGEGIVAGQYNIAVYSTGGCWRSHARGDAGVV